MFNELNIEEIFIDFIVNSAIQGVKIERITLCPHSYDRLELLLKSKLRYTDSEVFGKHVVIVGPSGPIRIEKRLDGES